jgi:hypothetical protein
MTEPRAGDTSFGLGSGGGTLLPSAARTAAIQTAAMLNEDSQYLDVIVDITAWTAGSITLTLQGQDPASGTWYTLLASAALAAVATTVLRIGPGLTAAANLVANVALPRTWRVSVAVGGAQSITYSIGFSAV